MKLKIVDKTELVFWKTEYNWQTCIRPTETDLTIERKRTQITNIKDETRDIITDHGGIKRIIKCGGMNGSLKNIMSSSLGSVNITLFGEKFFADVIKLMTEKENYLGLSRWALYVVACILLKRGAEGDRIHTEEE